MIMKRIIILILLIGCTSPTDHRVQILNSSIRMTNNEVGSTHQSQSLSCYTFIPEKIMDLKLPKTICSPHRTHAIFLDRDTDTMDSLVQYKFNHNFLKLEGDIALNFTLLFPQEIFECQNLDTSTVVKPQQVIISYPDKVISEDLLQKLADFFMRQPYKLHKLPKLNQYTGWHSIENKRMWHSFVCPYIDEYIEPTHTPSSENIQCDYYDFSVYLSIVPKKNSFSLLYYFVPDE